MSATGQISETRPGMPRIILPAGILARASKNRTKSRHCPIEWFGDFEEMMKRMTTITVVAALAASIGLNIYQHTELRHYGYLLDRGQVQYHSDLRMAYPIDGLSMVDMSAICAALDRQETNPQNRRIIEITMRDRNHVRVMTGIMNGGLCGIGRIFYFRREKAGWEIEEDKGSIGWQS